MAKKYTPIRVHIWRVKRKGDDVWKVAIDEPGGGPLTELKTRYTRKHGAQKGAWRKIAKLGREYTVHFIYEKP
jgi:hypothetical protein